MMKKEKRLYNKTKRKKNKIGRYNKEVRRKFNFC